MEYARWRHAVFGLLWPGLVYISVVGVGLLAGGRPASNRTTTTEVKTPPGKRATRNPQPASIPNDSVGIK
ncbi:hypothetical protein [Undibacterium parvum]|uniref:Uncharacterized protein n=1 Tax=Undibacterium parvum TaxID=401471 RepID=A0A3S9HMM8_9BURK|nr:hypothetical protein [Undibacterium parvum]AZP13325.1 hypothetical protein EJN92_15785 [Undibacterium parvum]